jgi:Phage integrase SAM-like domain/Arm DNA-binding domain
MEHRISVLYYIRKSKMTKDRLVPIYIRITVNGRRLDHSIQRYVDAAYWSAAAGRMKGNKEEARPINQYLDTLTGKVLKLEREMVRDGQAVNFENFRTKWLGITDRPRMLMEIFQQHNNQMAALVKVGNDNCAATLERYNTSRDHTRAFLQWKYGLPDIDISKLNYEFATDLEFWLKTVRNCSHNTTMKYISNLKKITNSCLRKSWLLKDPFLGFSMTKQEIEKEALTEPELKMITSKAFPTDRLQ